MKRIYLLVPAIGLGLLAVPGNAVPGGEIGTLPLGRYVCELPGDAAGAWRQPVPEQDFTVVNASSYVSHGQRGTYLLTGDLAQVTSGPLKGNRYHRLSEGFLRLIGEDGKDGDLRCVLAFRHNS